MAINVSVANNQAAQLRTQADRLRSAKRDLQSYKEQVVSSWKGPEVGYVLLALEQQIQRIDESVRELDSLANGVSGAAAAIKRREEAEAAAQRAREEKQRRIQNARADYNAACAEKASIENEIRLLTQRMKKAKMGELSRLVLQAGQLNAKLQDAENRCAVTKSILDGLTR